MSSLSSPHQFRFHSRFVLNDPVSVFPCVTTEYLFTNLLLSDVKSVVCQAAIRTGLKKRHRFIE